VNVEKEVRARLAEAPRSGGALIEQIPLRRDAVLVYGVLARLVRKGEIASLATGPGEEIFGVPGTPPPAPRRPGPPETFRMSDENLDRIERAVWKLTEGLPGHRFEELRRAVVARADRLAYEGADPDRAVTHALAELGPPASARSFLRALHGGKNPALRLSRRRARRLLLAVAAGIALLAAVRYLVVGPYRLPEGQISMAPALIPGVEGGDELILANLLAYRIGRPARGDVVLFDAPGQADPYVKRVMGLPGERVEIRDGDLWIDGERLVKDRAFLERVLVPLFGMEGFEEAGDGFRQKETADTGFRLPNGSRERRDQPAIDLVLEGTVELRDLKDALTILVKQGGDVRHQVVFNAVGYGAGVFTGNRTVARGQPCQLEPGRSVRFWFTNADRRLRLELDGKPVAEADFDLEDERPVRFEIVGRSVRDLRVARDLHYTRPVGSPDRWILGENAYFMLGDNSPMSRDSRSLGAISGDAILGRAWRVVWPPNRARAIR